MNKKHFLILSCVITLSGCNGVGVLLNPPTETGYYPPTEDQTAAKSSTGSSQKGTSTVIRKAPD